MIDIESGVKKILNTFFSSEVVPREFTQKEDGSLVTEIDIRLQKLLISFFKSIANNILVIAEEGAEVNQNYDLSESDFLILDPIDGTENFTFLKTMYGVALSWRISGKEGHLIYIPVENTFITSSNIVSIKTKSTIDLYSTKCLKTGFISSTDNARVLGSSSYMFYLLLSGKVRSYTYCDGAKIWDCYTGLALSKCAELRIDLVPSNYFSNPNFKQEFKIYGKI
jgi:myo-inositol-1(or 4)-monophosphatase